MNILKYFLLIGFIQQFNFPWGQDSVSCWKKYIDKNVRNLRIEQLDSSNVLKAYRIWNSYQLVELFQLKDSIYKGQIINYVEKVPGKGKKETYEVLSHKTLIPERKSKNLLAQLFKENIETLPDSEEIDGYPKGFDGTTYVFEIKTKDSYRIYSYWEPLNYNYMDGNIPEIDNVRNIVNKLNADFNLWKHFTDFRDSLPNGKYRYGGVQMEKL